MNTTHQVSSAAAGMSAIALCGFLFSGCTSSLAGTPGDSGKGGQVLAPSGRCSDPNPSPMALTFAAVVCIVGQSSIRQSDGSTELKIRVSVTDSDPNPFGVTAVDFQVQDSVGHSTRAADARQRYESSDCIAHSFTDNGWQLQPGQTFTVPGPFCFNIEAGSQPAELSWHDDVTVKLS